MMSSSHKYYLFFLVSILLVMMGAYLQGSTPPTPKAATVPPTEFSADRAYGHLTDLLQENIPHPTGSVQNRVIRDRIISKLKALNYTTEIQKSFSCGEWERSCAFVENIIAVKRGTTNNPAVMLSAHYDSVSASAAAFDDGAGVAVMLEIARNMTKLPDTENDIIFLFSDAEEWGLIGAAEFAKNHPLFSKVGSIINLEARGVTGLSAMFETGENNNRLMDVFRDNIKQPSSNSLTYEFYKTMPNSTDYTVYKKHDVTGFNFAVSGGVMAYHTVLDDLAHVDMKSLQHHGDNAYALVRALANINADALQSDTDSVYFDVFSNFLVKWSASWNFILILLCVVIAAGGMRVLKKTYKLKEYIYSVCGLFLSLFAVVVLGFVLSFPLAHWTDIHGLEHPHPWPGRIALFMLVTIVTLTTARWLSLKASPGAIVMMSAALSVILSVISALLMPGAVYLFLVPLLLFSMALAASFFLKNNTENLEIATFAGMTGAAYMAIYHYFMLDAIFNFQLSYLKVIPLFILMLWIIPLVTAHFSKNKETYKPAAIISICLLFISCLLGFLVPGFTEDRPRPINLVYMQDQDEMTAYWLMETAYGVRPDFNYIADGGFSLSEKSYRKQTILQNLNAPSLEVMSLTEEDGLRKIKVKITSHREAFQISLAFDNKDVINNVTVNGLHVAHQGGDIPIAVGVDHKSHIIDISLSGGEELTITLSDTAPLTGEQAQEILQHRPVTVRPIGAGDRSVVTRKYRL